MITFHMHIEQLEQGINSVRGLEVSGATSRNL